MRRERAESDGSSAYLVGHTFFFQIASNGERRACSVRIKSSTKDDASFVFREKWPVIEAMARGRMSAGNDGVMDFNLP